MQRIHYKTGKEVERLVRDLIEKQGKIVSFFLGKKRFIFLQKYIDATLGKADRSNRFQLFVAGIELIKTAKTYTIRKEGDMNSYELRGILIDGTHLAVHIREEFEQKDRKLFLISTFEIYK